jgi:hypothetical protein
MKFEYNLARLWVDDYDFQSNKVILADLFIRGGQSKSKPTIPFNFYKLGEIHYFMC